MAEMLDWHGLGRYLAELWNQEILGEIGVGIYSKGWKIIYSAGVKTRRP